MNCCCDWCYTQARGWSLTFFPFRSPSSSSFGKFNFPTSFTTTIARRMRVRDEKCINNPSVVFWDTFENGGSFDSYFLVNNNESLKKMWRFISRWLSIFEKKNSFNSGILRIHFRLTFKLNLGQSAHFKKCCETHFCRVNWLNLMIENDRKWF